ncbi:MAG: FeoA family protein [Bacteroidota bacterium]
MASVLDLKKGQTGTIITFDPEEIPLKLLQLGCLPGNEVKLMQIAPFKDPIQIDLNGTSIALRRSIAQKIQIELKHHPSES